MKIKIKYKIGNETKDGRLARSFAELEALRDEGVSVNILNQSARNVFNAARVLVINSRGDGSAWLRIASKLRTA